MFREHQKCDRLLREAVEVSTRNRLSNKGNECVSKKPKPFIVEIQAEGTHTERKLERADTQRLARELVSGLPDARLRADRQAYIRNLTVRALKREIDPTVFEEFMSLTNVQPEVEACLARASVIAEKKEM